jgi:ABC-type transporter Mla MlaB component
MPIPYKIIREPDPGRHAVTLLLNGKFGADALADLERDIFAARQAQQEIYLDLSEVTLIDRKSARFFADQTIRDVKLVNCPSYLQRWIMRGA